MVLRDKVRGNARHFGMICCFSHDDRRCTSRLERSGRLSAAYRCCSARPRAGALRTAPAAGRGDAGRHHRRDERRHGAALRNDGM